MIDIRSVLYCFTRRMKETQCDRFDLYCFTRTSSETIQINSLSHFHLKENFLMMKLI